ncbi:MAG TPA: DUF4139 domain-containing protein [Candidatus Omnitrophica bacterium]|nr:MAG: hypothetical protein A2Y05_02765 [Omnitrophica WOR_2 bacterium GWA2_53_43]HCI44814.1 DUF4139 domain-containing protein [Candidatus Omnitrophota bacterium]
MNKRTSILILIALMGWVPAATAAQTTQSAQSGQTNVEVTVYNNNLGLVKDTRDIQLPAGEGELRFMDVAAYIMPVTVHAKSLNAPEQFQVLEQNYEYDLMDYNKLMDKFVDKKVKLVDWNQYQDRKETVEGTLISNNNGNPVFKINDEIYLGYPGYKVLPEIPENLIAKPTLMWRYTNKSSDAHQLEVSYLTNNIGWKADYVFVLNKDDTGGDLSGWVTVDNKSGATYKNAKLKLVAGEVQRVADRSMDSMVRAKAPMMMEALGGSQFAEQAFFEYHIYDLQRRTTIKDKQTKQISLLEASGIKVEKELLVYGQQYYFTQHYRDQNPKQKVSVYVKFKNSKENQLGMPLPAGVLRLYKEDDKGSLQFVGEDNIEHTPKDEEVKVKVGEAFDVVAERRQTDFKQLTTRMYESAWEVTLRNHKEEPVRVGIIEPLQGNWQIVEQSHPSKKLDAFTLRFDVDVPKDGEVKVTYRVRVGI